MKKFKVKSFLILIINVIIINLNICNGQNIPESPCPNVFSYQQDNGVVYGLLTVHNMQINKENSVQLKVTNEEPGYGEQRLAPVQDRKTLFDSIRSGKPINFRVQFLSSNKIPEVLEIKSNDKILCVNSQIIPSGTSTIISYLKLTDTNDNFFLPLFSSSNNNNDDSPRIEIESPNWIVQDYYPTFSQPATQSNSISTFNNVITQPFNIPSSSQQTPSHVSIQSDNQFSNDNQDESGIVPRRQSSQGNLNPLYNNLKAICGTTAVSVRLIIGGKKFIPGAWPWLTALFRSSTTSFICGGSLISKTTVLTAAHCFGNNINLNDYMMGIGVHDLKKMREDGSLYLNLRKILLHPDYKHLSTPTIADIAIVILERGIDFTKNIRPICLYDNTDSIENKTGVVAGWGLSNEQSTPNIPTYVETRIVSDVECLRSNPVFNQLTSDRTFCAAGLVNGTGPCTGDSGGGLIIQKNGKWFLSGIVSESLLHPLKTCDLENFVVYIHVAKFVNWIEDNMTP